MDDDQWDAMYEAKFRERMGIPMDESQGVADKFMETDQGKLMDKSHGGIPGEGFLWCFLVIFSRIRGVINQMRAANIPGIKRMTSGHELDELIKSVIDRLQEGGHKDAQEPCE
jgi:hypothetical protein